MWTPCWQRFFYEGLLKPETLKKFGEALRGRLRDGQSGLARAYIRFLLDQAIVGKRKWRSAAPRPHCWRRRLTPSFF
jgi:hypothetical protein